MLKSSHWSNKYLLRTYYVLGPVLEAEDTGVTKTEKSYCPQIAYSLICTDMGKWNIKTSGKAG